MLRILITGKPRGFELVKPKEGSKIAARFFLDEKRFVDGKNLEIVWECYIPEHKVKWVQRQVEKGYTVAVEGTDVAFGIEKGGSIEWVVPLLMVVEVSGL